MHHKVALAFHFAVFQPDASNIALQQFVSSVALVVERTYPYFLGYIDIRASAGHCSRCSPYLKGASALLHWSRSPEPCDAVHRNRSSGT